jgi:hypothetical protein
VKLWHGVLLACWPLLGTVLGSCGTSVTASMDRPHFETLTECDDAPVMVTFQTFQAAVAVLGQPDYQAQANNRGNANPTADRFFTPTGLSCGSLWIADSANNRVLKFATPVSPFDDAAVLVLGHTNFTDSTFGLSAAAFSFPSAVREADGQLFVCDFLNNRVLIWNSVPTTSGQAANVVLGQPNFTSMDFPADTPNASSLTVPNDCVSANGKLLVSDGVDRILIWNSIPTLNGQAADMVLGQPGFTSKGPGLSASGLNDPYRMWTDGTRLVVADRGNNRVLIWTSFPTANGQAADLVLGQTTMDSGKAGTGPSGLKIPEGVHSNGTQLVVADTGNHRVLVWHAFPTANGHPADVVLGQGDFNHQTNDDDNQDAIPDGSAGPRTFEFPRAVLLLGDKLYVSDSSNSRVLVFQGQVQPRAGP